MTDMRLCDFHIHTEYSHDCATPLITIKQIARKHDLILAITDHNEIRGSLAATALGIPTIPAIEVTTKHLKDFLIYFPEQDNLIEFYTQHIKPRLDPGMIWGSKTTLSEAELLEAAAQYDSFVSLAHPYCPPPKRSARLRKEHLAKIQGIEVMNFAMSPKANTKAATLCDINKKIHTAGSDSHVPQTIGAVTMRAYGETPQEFLASIRQGASVVVGMQRTTRDVMDKVKQYIAYKATH